MCVSAPGAGRGELSPVLPRRPWMIAVPDITSGSGRGAWEEALR